MNEPEDMIPFKPLTDAERDELQKSLEALASDPLWKYKITVLPPSTLRVAILRDNCDTMNCPDYGDHECGQTLMVSQDIKGVERAKELYEQHVGEAWLEIVETMPHGWQPAMVVEVETCVSVKTGEVHETDRWSYLDFNDLEEKPPTAKWCWEVVVVSSLFRQENEAEALERHAATAECIGNAIKRLVEKGNAPTNGPDISLVLLDEDCEKE